MAEVCPERLGCQLYLLHLSTESWCSVAQCVACGSRSFWMYSIAALDIRRTCSHGEEVFISSSRRQLATNNVIWNAWRLQTFAMPSRQLPIHSTMLHDCPCPICMLTVLVSGNRGELLDGILLPITKRIKDDSFARALCHGDTHRASLINDAASRIRQMSKG